MTETTEANFKPAINYMQMILSLFGIGFLFVLFILVFSDFIYT